MGGASAYIDHADAIGSTTMETDPSGAVQWDVVNGPWGQAWQETGTRQSAVWAGLFGATRSRNGLRPKRAQCLASNGRLHTEGGSQHGTFGIFIRLFF